MICTRTSCFTRLSMLGVTMNMGASEWQAMPLKSRDKIELQKVDAFFELRREEFLKGLEEPRQVYPGP